MDPPRREGVSTPDSDAPILPLAGLGVAILTVSTNAVLVRWSTAPSLVRALHRVLFTVALLAPVALAHHRGVLATISERDLLTVRGVGVTLTAHLASWFKSLNHTTVAASVTLVQFQPLFVAVGAWAVLGEHVSHRTVVGIGITLAGMTLMFVSDFLTAGGAPRPLPGNGLTIIGAVTAAAYILTGRSIRSRASFVPCVVVVYPVYATTLLAVAVGRDDPLAGYLPHEWLLFLRMAVGPGIFDCTIINWTLAHLESSIASVSPLGESVGGTIPAFFLLGEIPTLPTVLGRVVVLSGIYVSAS